MKLLYLSLVKYRPFYQTHNSFWLAVTFWLAEQREYSRILIANGKIILRSGVRDLDFVEPHRPRPSMAMQSLEFQINL